MLAAVDSSGPFAAVCGITWVLLWPTSGVSALVSLALCPFQRTVRQALRLSKVGLWSGFIAFVVAIVVTIATDGVHHDPMNMLLIELTGLPPVLAFFTGQFTRHKIAELDTVESANKTAQPVAATTSNPASTTPPGTL